jgi:DNA-binding NtrC family response regulator
LAQLGERLGRPAKRLSPEALTHLARHAWPGNVRELRNAVERAAVLATGDEIGAADLALPEAGDPAIGAPTVDPGDERAFSEAKRDAVERFERAYLLRALREHDGNVSRTAEAIGMVRQSLQQKIRELGLREEDWSRPAPGPAGGTTR